MRWAVLVVTLASASIGCSHTRQLEQQVHVISEDANGVGVDHGSGTGGSGVEAYCNELQRQCFQKCWDRKPSISSIKKGSAMHHHHCTQICREEFMRCIEKQEEAERQDSSQKEKLHFPTMDVALVWLREHKSEVAIGTVVIIAGVVAAPYVITIAAGGALVLAPL
jgi:hypothetical protein